MYSKLEVIKGDITKIEVDTIVNAANSSLLGGGGVDGAIHRAGGRAILDECRSIIARQGRCRTGEAVITTAGNLPSNFVIHTVGPVWNGGNKGEAEKLAACYQNSISIAILNGCKTVAFPNISTGIYGYPKEDAAKIAVDTVVHSLKKDNKIEKVFFVCFDEENYHLIQKQINMLIPEV